MGLKPKYKTHDSDVSRLWISSFSMYFIGLYALFGYIEKEMVENKLREIDNKNIK